MRVVFPVVAAAVVVGAVLAGWAIRPAEGAPGAEAGVRIEMGSPPAVVLERGEADPEVLDRAAAGVGHPGAVERDGEAWVLAATVVVEEGATLRLDDVDLRLVSEPGTVVGLEARGGRILAADSLVTSWDRQGGTSDANVRDGRAWVLARDGAEMTVRTSTFRMLGYDAHERYGVSWRTSGTGGSIQGSTFAGNFFGVYTFGVDPMRVTDSLIRNSIRYGLDLHTGSDGFVIERNRLIGNGKHGLVLAVRCRDAVIRDNVSADNGAHGFVIFDRSDDAVLEHNEAYGNGGSGFDISGSSGVMLRDNLAHANERGVFVHDRADAVTLRGNRVAGNRSDGVRVASGGRIDSMEDNLVDFNYRAGVYVDDGEVRIEGNQVLDNVVGLWFSGGVDAASVTGNTIGGNVLDGVHLTGVLQRLTIEGNRIVDSGKAAFSSSTRGQADRFVHLNELEGNEAESRIRVAE